MKRSSQIMQKKYFQNDDVIDDVTGRPQSRPFMFLYKWNNNVFHDNLKTSKDIIIKLPVHRYHELMLQFDLRYEKIIPNYAKKSIFIMMTSSMASQGGLKVSLYIHV